MASLILIHGSFHGPWCWSRITRQLTDSGHHVILADLAQANGKQDLHSYANHVAALIDAAPDPVVLIGHSMGGLVASQAAELRAGRVASIIYIAGLLLRDGETLNSFITAHAALGVRDLVLEAMQLSADGAIATFPQSEAARVFYNGCSEADATWAAGQLSPQPTAVYATPLSLTETGFGRIPRCYVRAARDRAVVPAYQDAMTQRLPCNDVVTLDSDHSPFLSMPEALVEALLTLIEATKSQAVLPNL
jgi:pimeloyl-ACP methyl ester carboxylesterase